ncbi:hypothetical protein GCM10009868_01420 [Terrabacter aerolatus]|uniref:Uncharacterized protein n=1 Tax=Terrabacter aerolatus TaxID=422442 RepID=A0A512D5U8_9MICO|nr:hypothetical protein TAE01_36070 [Terrabacter aerolatus]
MSTRRHTQALPDSAPVEGPRDLTVEKATRRLAPPHWAVSHWTSEPGEIWPERDTRTVAHTFMPLAALTV